MVRLMGTLIRYLASQLGMAGRFAKLARSHTSCSAFDPTSSEHDWCSIVEIGLALRSQSPMEIERVSDALNKLGSFTGEMTLEIAESLGQTWKTVNEILLPVLQMVPDLKSVAI